MVNIKSLILPLSLFAICVSTPINARTAGVRRTRSLRVNNQELQAAKKGQITQTKDLHNEEKEPKAQRNLKDFIPYIAAAFVVGLLLFINSSFGDKSKSSEEEDKPSEEEDKPSEKSILDGTLEMSKVNINLQKGNGGMSGKLEVPSPNKFEKLKLGGLVAEQRWLGENIKEGLFGNANGVKNTEVNEFEQFKKNTKLVLNPELLASQFSPNMREFIKILDDRLRMQKALGENEKVNITSEEVTGMAGIFFTTYRRIRQEAIKEEATRLEEKRKQETGRNSLTEDDKKIIEQKRTEKTAEEMTFEDDTSSIQFLKFEMNMINEYRLGNQISKLSNYTEQEGLKSLYYIFLKMEEMLRSKNEEAESTVFSILSVIAPMFDHCHGRTKRAFFYAFVSIGLSIGGEPQSIFGKMYWFTDSFKGYALDQTYKDLITNSYYGTVPPYQDVHEQNALQGHLYDFGIRLPGIEVGKEDTVCKNRYNRNEVVKGFFSYFNEESILNQFIEYIQGFGKQYIVQGKGLEVEKVNEFYYTLITGGEQLAKLPNTREKGGRLSKEVAKNWVYIFDEDYQVEVDPAKLLYCLYRLGFYVKVGDDYKGRCLHIQEENK